MTASTADGSPRASEPAPGPGSSGALVRGLGPVAAIIIQAYPFFLLHQHKPEPEMISSWFGGILMGWLCWRAKSAWPSFLLHWVLYTTMEVTAFIAR